MKPSHYVTPRTLNECHFVPGYRSAEPRDRWAEAGHIVLNACCVAAIVIGLPLLLLGVI